MNEAFSEPRSTVLAVIQIAITPLNAGSSSPSLKNVVIEYWSPGQGFSLSFKQVETQIVMHRYFAYGSNCSPEILKKKSIEYISSQRAVLRGYRLLFNKKSLRERLPDCIGFANINEDPEGVVEGVLYELSEENLEKLDVTERYPDHYFRVQVEVEAEGEMLGCWAYKAQPNMIADGLVPSRNYLNHILAGSAFLSPQYLEALDQSQTYLAECACCRREGEVLFVSEGDLLHTLCQPCREARLNWSDVHGRMLTISETGAVMTELVMTGAGFESMLELIQEAVARKLIDQ